MKECSEKGLVGSTQVSLSLVVMNLPSAQLCVFLPPLSAARVQAQSWQRIGLWFHQRTRQEKGKTAVNTCKRLIIMMTYLFKLGPQGRRNIKGVQEREKVVKSMDCRS